MTRQTIMLAIGLAAVPTVAHAAAYPTTVTPVSLTSATYSQNFNTLASTGTTATTLPAGWQLSEGSGDTAYRVSDGSANNGDLYSFGTTGSTDRALGSLGSGSNTPLYFGAFFTNNLGSTISGLSFAYTGEQWRGGSADDDQLTFQYSFNANSIDSTTATWLNLASLNFLAPNASTAGALDGNLAANRTALIGSLANLAIANGATFSIRWSDVDNSGSDDGLGIDDFRLTATAGAAVPEPSTWAMMLVGFGAIGLSMRYRGRVKAVLA